MSSRAGAIFAVIRLQRIARDFPGGIGRRPSRDARVSRSMQPESFAEHGADEMHRTSAQRHRARASRRTTRVNHETAMRGASIALAFGLAAACASSPPPNEKLAAARESFERAERSGAAELAPGEMTVARDKLERAERADTKHDAKLAAGLAEEARVDADLAEAEAQEIKSHKAEVELEASLAVLRRESSTLTAPQPLIPVPQSPPPRSPSPQ
jgi:hypothetical protein